MAKIYSKFYMTINGELVSSEHTIDVLNPATEEVLASIPDCTETQLNAAVGSARAAFSKWRKTTWQTRADLICKLADVIEANADDLALSLSREQGKHTAESELEIKGTAGYLRLLAEKNIESEERMGDRGRKYRIRQDPIGVVAAIAPWNFPIGLAFWKSGPALITGNTVVLKPSPFTPLTTLKIAELAAGIFPPGVFNVVSGGDRLGPWLTEHPEVDKITFTGSTQTGKAVMRSAATSLKRVTLELGGNDAAIVLPGTDIKEIVGQLYWGAFRNAGQICVASKRIFIHESQFDEVLVEFQKLAQLNLPKPYDADDATMGPVQNKPQYERVQAMIEDVRTAGGQILEPEGTLPDSGYFIKPTIVVNPPDDWPIVKDEPFGPVVPLLKYKTIDEVIERANSTEYGLGAIVWSPDPEQAIAVGEQIEAGTVWINGITSPDPALPFGGLKQSGMGVEHGIEGLKEFTYSKVLAL